MTLTQEGAIKSHKVPGNSGRMYDLIPTIQDYIKFLSDKAYGRAQSDKELELKEKKLKAEIALKESQGELHRLRTEIAAGKFIAVEEVKLDYQRFFVIFKKFATAIPNRISGMVNGYVDLVTVRAIEKDLNNEIAAMLQSFVVAAEAAPISEDGAPDE